jgi:putative ABC transport system permease protein
VALSLIPWPSGGRIALAWANLLHQKKRTLVAILGVAFAVILVFVQLGFRAAVEETATIMYEALNFDLVLISSQYSDLNHSEDFPLDRLTLARQNAEVERAMPVYVGFQLWRRLDIPEQLGAAPSSRGASGPASRPHRGIMIVGFRPTDPVFLLPEIQSQQYKLQQPDTVLIDRRSQPEFGYRALPPQLRQGVQTELGLHRVTVVGDFKLGTGFGADGLVVCSDETLLRILRGRSPDRVNLGLIKLRGQPSATRVQEVAADLRLRLPADVRVRTRAGIEAHEKIFWLQITALGIIFGFGVAVAVLVGIVFVYQVISSDITNRLREFATLKAMGFPPGYLSGVVLQQAWLLAFLGYVPGLVVALTLYAVMFYGFSIPVTLDPWRIPLVLAATVGMCSVSGLLALHKVRAADPADLF